MKYAASNALCSIVLSTVALSGCSDGLKTIPVYGKVAFAGRETPKVCKVFFQPVKVEGLSRPSTTECESDGSYKVKAFEHSAGLVPGTYHVRLFYYDLKPGANPAIDSSWRETPFDAGEVVVPADSSGVEHNIEIPSKSKG